MISAAKYRSIMNEYDEKRRKRDYLISERRSNLYKECPEYEAIEQEITGLHGKRARAMVGGNYGVVQECDKALDDAEKTRIQILSRLNLDDTYLNPPYECPDCKDTGMIESSRCHCLQQKIINVMYEQSYVRRWDDTFDTLDYNLQVMSEDKARFRNVVEKCQEFCVELGAAELRNLYITGPVGIGKTKLCNCIANEILRSGKSCIYLTFQRLTKIFVNAAKGDADGEELRQRLFECDVLILDDLGTEAPSEFFLKEFFELVNERIINELPFVISSNLNNQQLREQYGERICTRILAESKICLLSGSDVRNIIKNRKKELIKNKKYE